MNLQIKQKHLDDIIARLGAGFATAVEAAIVERLANYLLIDQGKFIELKVRHTPPLTPKELVARKQEALARQAAYKAAILQRLHDLWDELHTHRDWTAEKMEQFILRLPCGDCRKHWREIIKRKPPPYGDPEAMFVWGVEAHDEVSVDIGKPVFGLAAARVKYRSNS